MHETILTIDLIATNPAVRGGRPVIRGRTLCVQDVVAAHFLRKETLEEIAENYGLSMAQIHAALTYYYAHQAEIDAQLAVDLALAETLEQQGAGKNNPPLFG